MSGRPFAPLTAELARRSPWSACREPLEPVGGISAISADLARGVSAPGPPHPGVQGRE